MALFSQLVQEITTFIGLYTRKYISFYNNNSTGPWPYHKRPIRHPPTHPFPQNSPGTLRGNPHIIPFFFLPLLRRILHISRYHSNTVSVSNITLRNSTQAHPMELEIRNIVLWCDSNSHVASAAKSKVLSDAGLHVRHFSTPEELMKEYDCRVGDVVAVISSMMQSGGRKEAGQMSGFELFKLWRSECYDRGLTVSLCGACVRVRVCVCMCVSQLASLLCVRVCVCLCA